MMTINTEVLSFALMAKRNIWRGTSLTHSDVCSFAKPILYHAGRGLTPFGKAVSNDSQFHPKTAMPSSSGNTLLRPFDKASGQDSACMGGISATSSHPSGVYPFLRLKVALYSHHRRWLLPLALAWLRRTDTGYWPLENCHYLIDLDTHQLADDWGRPLFCHNGLPFCGCHSAIWLTSPTGGTKGFSCQPVNITASWRRAAATCGMARR